MLYRGKLAAPSDDFFSEDPVRLIELFHPADMHGLALYPLTMRQAGRDIGLIDARVWRDPPAHPPLLDVPQTKPAADSALRHVPEAGFIGHFITDSVGGGGLRNVTMYHHYTKS